MPHKRKGYNQISRGGTEYLDLTDPEVLKELSPTQRFYIEHQEKWYNEKVIIGKAEYYDSLQSDIERQLAIQRQYDVLSGRLYRESQRTFFENYEKGLAFRGENELAQLMALTVKARHGQRFLQSLYQDLPDLSLFYADKRSRTGNDTSDKQVAGDTEETYSDVQQRLIEYALKAGLSKRLIDYTLAGGFEDVNIDEISLKEARLQAKIDIG